MKASINKLIPKLFILSGAFVCVGSLLSFSPKTEKETNLVSICNWEKQISITITKTTTLEELENIKATLKEQGFFIDFKKVAYNENNEIIAISIQYKDQNNNSGNYSVSSQNPINDIKIQSKGEGISLLSLGNSNQAFINQGNNPQTPKNHRNNNAPDEMKKNMEQMELEMEARMKAMEAKRAERKLKMDKYRDSIINTHQLSSASMPKSRTITSNTSDLELSELQKTYKGEDISFTYTDLARNANDEITHISISINNRAGSISTSTFGNGKDAIKTINIAVDKQHTILKNAE